MATLATATLLLVSVAAADEDDAAVRAARSQAAQVITLAKLLPDVCRGIMVDEEALAALMDHAQLTPGDLKDPNGFGPEDEDTAEILDRAVRENRDEVCAKLVPYLGERGAKLLRRKPGSLD